MALSNSELLIQAAQREVLESYRKEFDQLCSAFRDLESKAQGTAALAGAFLAAGLALFNRSGGLAGQRTEILLLLGVVGLAGAILFSVLALRVRRVRGCPSGGEVARIVDNLKGIEDEKEISERLLYFYGDTAALWRACVEDRKVANNAKARHVWSAQLCLTSAASCVVALIIVLIVSP